MVYLAIDEKLVGAKDMLNFMKTLPFVQFVELSDIPNAETIKAIKQVRSGKGKRAKNIGEFLTDFKQSLQEVKNNKTKPLKNLLKK